TACPRWRNALRWAATGSTRTPASAAETAPTAISAAISSESSNSSCTGATTRIATVTSPYCNCGQRPASTAITPTARTSDTRLRHSPIPTTTMISRPSARPTAAPTMRLRAPVTVPPTLPCTTNRAENTAQDGSGSRRATAATKATATATIIWTARRIGSFSRNHLRAAFTTATRSRRGTGGGRSAPAAACRSLLAPAGDAADSERMLLASARLSYRLRLQEAALQQVAVERLHHVLVGARLHGQGDLSDVVLGDAEYNHRRGAADISAQQLEEFQTAHDRHLRVEEDGIGHLLPALVESLLPILGLFDNVVHILKDTPRYFADDTGIIDDETGLHSKDPFFSGRPWTLV